MNNNFIPYSELKSKINLMEVAQELGYKLNLSDGKKFPVMVKTDGAGRKIDSIVICNPGNNERMGYFRHSGGKGDVITLIRENQNELSKYGNSLYRILMHYAGAENLPKVENASLWKDDNKNSRPFSLDNYSIETLKDREFLMQKLFQTRAISLSTVKVFSDNLLKVSHWQPSKRDGQDRWMATNLGFPYRFPGNSEIVGLELRGYNFKSKTAGSNSSDAVWSIDFNKNPKEVTAVYFAESPFDLMAMYEVQHNSINLATSAFVATGGAFSQNQILNAMKYYSNARAYDCFDNDLPGRVYGIRMMMLLEGRTFAAIASGKNYNFTVDNKLEFSLPKDMVNMQEFRRHVDTRYAMGMMKAPPEYKDWNDVTMGKRIDGKVIEENGLARHLDDNYNKRLQEFKNRR